MASSSWYDSSWASLSSSLVSFLGLATRKPKLKLLILGVAPAGKTTLLYKLKDLSSSDIIAAMPTIGFNVEQFELDGYEVTGWDVGGRSRARLLNRHYYPGTDLVMYVVDSSIHDEDHIEYARDEFYREVMHEELYNIPVLLLCNKQDLPRAKSPEEIAEYYGIKNNRIVNSTIEKERPVFVQGCSLLENYGMKEGFSQLLQGALTSRGVSSRVRHNDNIESNQGSATTTMTTTTATTTTKTTITKVKTGSVTTNQAHNKHKNNKEKDKKSSLFPVKHTHNVCLERFKAIKNSTECPFAKGAKLWGGKSLFQTGTSIEMQAKEHIKPLLEFTHQSNQGEALDGFCIDIDDELAKNTKDPKEFGQCVRRMLTALADLDPSTTSMMNQQHKQKNIMKVSYVGSTGWRFRFDNTDFFVTTFAPCYPESSSRYAFGSNRAFILLQPERSFERHDLPDDTGVTNWENPQTIRDKTRIAYSNVGRPYYIPPTPHYAMAEHIVKPLIDASDGSNIVRWWVSSDDSEKHENTLPSQPEKEKFLEEEYNDEEKKEEDMNISGK